LFTDLHDVRLYLFINENLLVTRPLLPVILHLTHPLLDKCTLKWEFLLLRAC
jgi:hypothetical protein